jgi:Glycosyltransferase family 87
MSKRSLFLILGLLVALICLTALRIGAPELFGVDAVSADYMIFHQVGELANLGRVAEAYDAPAFKAYQLERTGSSVFMTWTYPPHFNLALQVLAPLGVGLGYFVFTTLSLAFFIWGLFRFGSDAAVWALSLTMPAMAINLLTGQNGFLTAGLMALFAGLALAQRSRVAGLVLGLLTYKPHLGLSLGLAALLRGGWRMVAVACVTLLALLALATLLYGPDIWPAFLGGVKTSGELLQAGEYKFSRMITPFTLMASFGFANASAMAVHVVWLLISFGVLTWGCLKGWRLAHVISLAILSGATLSPYAYDYDMCLLAPALALALPAIQGLGKPARMVLGASALLAGGYGLTTALLADQLAGSGLGQLSLGGLGLMLTQALAFYAMARAEAAHIA